MKKFSLFIILFSVFTNPMLSQDIVIGEEKKIQSAILNEERTYWISLPSSYNNNDIHPLEYPVLYILDYRSLFVPFSGVVKHMNDGNANNQIPEMIVVAIQSTNRPKDATPTFSKIDYQGNESEGLSSTGGADLFLEFLQKELIQEIDNNYRTSDFKILTGHSLDGLTVIHSLLSSPKNFNAYISIDPSLWWDDQVMLKKVQSLNLESHFSNQYLFLARAKNVLSIPTRVSEFTDFIEENKDQKLNWHYKYYENEDHNSVTLPSIYDALSDLFMGHKIDQDAYYAHPERIQPQFKDISKRLNTNLYPSPNVMLSFGNMYLNSEVEKAIIYFKINTDNFPDSKLAWIKLAGAYVENNQCKEAIQCLSKSLTLDPSQDRIKDWKSHLEKDKPCLKKK